jgi:MFS family permease
VKSSYTPWRTLWKYLGGTLMSRAGDEMAGPALLLLGFAVTGKPAVGSALLAGLTIGAAVGGPLFGALLDRSPRPDRILAVTLASYTVGVIAVAAAVGRVPVPLVVLIALAAGLFTAAVAGGWTSQLPRIVTGPALDRGFALDATTYSAASLAGPALAALVAAGFGARTAVVIAAVLVALAVPSACSLSRYRPPRVSGPRPAPYRQMAAGFAAIVTRRRLLRATVTSAVSYVGLGMLLVCCPLLGAQRLGGSARGALLISAIAAASLVTNSVLARRPSSSPGSSPGSSRASSQPDVRVLVSTVVMGVSMALASVAAGWFTLAAVALSGVGEGPQLTALFSVRHRESPEHLRGQIFTTAASLKVAGLAAGAALAGPLAGQSVTACLLLAAGFDLCAAAAYVLIGPRRTGRPQVPLGPRQTGPTAGTTARSE